MFKRLFGASDSKDVPSRPAAVASSTAVKSQGQVVNTVQVIQDQIEIMEKKVNLYEKRIEEYMRKAREFTKLNKKTQALQCVKQKQKVQIELDRVMNLISVLEDRKLDIEAAQTNTGHVSAVGQYVQTTKQLQKKVR